MMEAELFDSRFAKLQATVLLAAGLLAAQPALAQLAPPPQPNAGQQTPFPTIPAQQVPVVQQQPTAPQAPVIDPVKMQRLQALKDRRAALDERARKLAVRDQPQTQAQLDAIAGVAAQIQSETQTAGSAAWRAATLSTVLQQLQQGGFRGAAPINRLRINPAIVYTTRANQAYLNPDPESRSLSTFDAGTYLTKVADLEGLDWVMIWIDPNRGYAFMPTSSVQVFQ